MDQRRRLVCCGSALITQLLASQSTQLIASSVVLHGFRLFVHTQWLRDRSKLLKYLLQVTGDSQHTLVASVVSIRRSQVVPVVLQTLFAEFQQSYDALLSVDTPLGTVMTGKPGECLVLLADGDYDAHLSHITLKLNLDAFGFLAKDDAVDLLAVTDQTIRSFFTRLGLDPHLGPIDRVFLVLVMLAQQTLYFFNTLGVECIDGLICNSTLDALEHFFFLLGPFEGIKFSVTSQSKPWLDPAMFSAMLDKLNDTRAQLGQLGYNPPKGLHKLDPNTLRKQIKHFQKDQGLEVSMVFDAATLGRLVSSGTMKRMGASRVLGGAVTSIRSKFEDITGLHNIGSNTASVDAFGSAHELSSNPLSATQPVFHSSASLLHHTSTANLALSHSSPNPVSQSTPTLTSSKLTLQEYVVLALQDFSAFTAKQHKFNEALIAKRLGGSNASSRLTTLSSAAPSTATTNQGDALSMARRQTHAFGTSVTSPFASQSIYDNLEASRTDPQVASTTMERGGSQSSSNVLALEDLSSRYPTVQTVQVSEVPPDAVNTQRRQDLASGTLRSAPTPLSDTTPTLSKPELLYMNPMTQQMPLMVKTNNLIGDTLRGLHDGIVRPTTKGIDTIVQLSKQVKKQTMQKASRMGSLLVSSPYLQPEPPDLDSVSDIEHLLDGGGSSSLDNSTLESAARSIPDSSYIANVSYEQPAAGVATDKRLKASGLTTHAASRLSVSNAWILEQQNLHRSCTTLPLHINRCRRTKSVSSNQTKSFHAKARRKSFSGSDSASLYDEVGIAYHLKPDGDIDIHPKMELAIKEVENQTDHLQALWHSLTAYEQTIPKLNKEMASLNKLLETQTQVMQVLEQQLKDVSDLQSGEWERAVGVYEAECQRVSYALGAVEEQVADFSLDLYRLVENTRLVQQRAAL